MGQGLSRAHHRRVCIRVFRHKPVGFVQRLWPTRCGWNVKNGQWEAIPIPTTFSAHGFSRSMLRPKVWPSRSSPGPKMTLALVFAPEVQKWTWLVEREGHFVFYTIENDDWTGPLQLLSLDFAKPNFFYYQVGGEVEEVAKALETPKYKRLN